MCFSGRLFGGVFRFPFRGAWAGVFVGSVLSLAVLETFNLLASLLFCAGVSKCWLSQR